MPEPFVRELDFSTLERVSGEYVSADLHHAYGDQVWRARWKNFPGWCYLVILIEFQRKPERMMAFRLWSYQALVLQRLWDEGQWPRNEAGQELLPLLFSVVVYNGEGTWTAPLDLRELSGAVPESLRDYQPQLKYCLVDVHRLVLDRPEHRNSLMAAVARIERAMRFRDISGAWRIAPCGEAVRETVSDRGLCRVDLQTLRRHGRSRQLEARTEQLRGGGGRVESW